jgi:hypothetical protein
MVGVAGLVLSLNTGAATTAPPAQTQPETLGGYSSATISQLKRKAPGTYWVGQSIGGTALYLHLLGKVSQPAQSALYYGGDASIASLAVFLYRPQAGVRIHRLVLLCRQGQCGAGWRLRRFSHGIAMVQVARASWLARVVIGDSVLYINCNLPGVTVAQVLADLVPIGEVPPA